MAELKDDSGLFKADRRVEERENPSDRRTIMRASLKLRILGILTALAVAAILSGVFYFSNR